MTRVCPNCQKTVYSRNLTQCGYCKAPLPDNLFTEEYVGPRHGPEFQAPRVIDDYRTLSLSARLAVGLHCFERYCQARGLRHDSIDTFLDHMWNLPCTRFFPEWEKGNCDLVNVGLGGSVARELLDLLAARSITEAEFRRLVECVVEIVYSSAYGASDDVGSLKYLDQVFSITGVVGVAPPPTQLFLISRFGEQHGWGTLLNRAQRDAWRSKAYEPT